MVSTACVLTRPVSTLTRTLLTPSFAPAESGEVATSYLRRMSRHTYSSWVAEARCEHSETMVVVNICPGYLLPGDFDLCAWWVSGLRREGTAPSLRLLVAFSESATESLPRTNAYAGRSCNTAGLDRETAALLHMITARNDGYRSTGPLRGAHLTVHDYMISKLSRLARAVRAGRQEPGCCSGRLKRSEHVAALTPRPYS